MSKTVFRRLDILESDLGAVKKTDEGFAHFFARATRTGVFKYRNADGGIRKELRLPDEVFSADSMQTLANKPITNDHPTKLLDSKNSREYTIGMTGDSVTQDGQFLKTKAVITDEKTINDVISKGKAQVSCGYVCEHDVTPGVYDGETYDLIQRNIRYNHLAVVDLGRAGPEARLRLDSICLDAQDAIMVTDIAEKTDDKEIEGNSEETQKNTNREDSFDMVKITIDGTDHEVSEEFKKAFDSKIQKESEKHKSDSVVKDSLISELQAKLDTIKEKLSKDDDATKKANSDAEINARVKARVALYDAAKERCDEEITKKLDSMSDLEIKKAIIKTTIKSDAINLDEKDEIYISTRFDIVMESPKEESKSDSSKVLGSAIIAARHDGKMKPNEDPRMNNYKKSGAMSKSETVKV